MPGHGKGICDSKGGINKHAVKAAALSDVVLVTPWELYVYLSNNGVDVMSKTAHALHRPDLHKFHYFREGEFLSYHPIDLKIDRINCYHAFAIAKSNPLHLYSRNTSCFCKSCKLGNFLVCLDVQFHGAWHTNVLNIETVDCVPDDINLAVNTRAFEFMQELHTSYTKPYLNIF